MNVLEIFSNIFPFLPDVMEDGLAARVLLYEIARVVVDPFVREYVVEWLAV